MMLLSACTPTEAEEIRTSSSIEFSVVGTSVATDTKESKENEWILFRISRFFRVFWKCRNPIICISWWLYINRGIRRGIIRVSCKEILSLISVLVRENIGPIQMNMDNWFALLQERLFCKMMLLNQSTLKVKYYDEAKVPGTGERKSWWRTCHCRFLRRCS